MLKKTEEGFAQTFGRPPEALFSAPGRTELGGNHTDHQCGTALAAAVDRAAFAAVSPNGTGTVRLVSEGYPKCEISLYDLADDEAERGKTAALLRGIASRFSECCSPSGLDIYVTSEVPAGSGLSSSAAFEILLGTVFNVLWDAGRTPAELAAIGQYAEKERYGKPCGLLDQTVSASGGVVMMDFETPSAPKVEQIGFDFSACGHALVLVDTGAGHENLTNEYAAIPAEMKKVCDLFGVPVLRQLNEEAFSLRLKEVREAAGDRAALRAMHFFAENRRVPLQAAALRENRFDDYLRLVNESGKSSWLLLQNVTPAGETVHQETAFALALCEKLLGGAGACRVHGGGFGGAVQVYVPEDGLTDFRKRAEAVLGDGCCHVMHVREAGGVRII